MKIRMDHLQFFAVFFRLFYDRDGRICEQAAEFFTVFSPVGAGFYAAGRRFCRYQYNTV